MIWEAIKITDIVFGVIVVMTLVFILLIHKGWIDWK
jgi:hypothetical protein